MALQYKVKQDNRQSGTGLWYGRATHPSTVTLDTIADRIQRTCSMTKADVLAVITEAINVMNDEMQNSNKVRLDGLGTFYLTIQSSGANTEEDYNASDNIRSVRVRFAAQLRKQNGVMVKQFTDGVTFKKV